MSFTDPARRIGPTDTRGCRGRPHPRRTWRVLGLMFSDSPAIHHTRYAQPALFAVSYALGAALLELGVEPAFLTGHSGRVRCGRPRRGIDPRRGGTTRRLAWPADAATACRRRDERAVDVPADDVAALVAAEPSCGIAAVNGPRSTVVSGPAEAVDRITRTLTARGAKITRSLCHTRSIRRSWRRRRRRSATSPAPLHPAKQRSHWSRPCTAGSSTAPTWTPTTGPRSHLDRPVCRRDCHRRRRPHPPTSSSSARGRPCWASLAAAGSAHLSAPWRRAAADDGAGFARSPHSFTPTG